jgi:hypothetical protein
MGNNILVFPAGMPQALNFLDQNKLDSNIIGASSISNDPFLEKYSQWTYLPFVIAPEFNDVLKEVIDRFDINEIFTPNPVVWNHLKNNLYHLIKPLYAIFFQNSLKSLIINFIFILFLKQDQSLLFLYLTKFYFLMPLLFLN